MSSSGLTPNPQLHFFIKVPFNFFASLLLLLLFTFFLIKMAGLNGCGVCGGDFGVVLCTTSETMSVFDPLCFDPLCFGPLSALVKSTTNLRLGLRKIQKSGFYFKMYNLLLKNTTSSPGSPVQKPGAYGSFYAHHLFAEWPKHKLTMLSYINNHL